jgi:multiple sugar transport system permease protein
MHNGSIQASKGTKRRRKKGRWLPLLFIGPHLIIFVIFVLIPIVFGIYISFTQWDLIGAPRWVGLDNFKEILFNTSSSFYRMFTDGMKNTLLFVVLNVPLCMVIPLAFALVLHLKPYGSKLYQSVLYMPTLFSITAVGIIWMQLLNRRFGLISIFNPTKPPQTHMPEAWVWLMVMTVWWTMASNMVIYQSALAGVSKELYESAEIDGAGPWKRFTSITLPSIKFQLLYTLVITLAGSFNVYGQPTIMTRVDPAHGPAIQVLVFHIRGLAFGSGQSVAGIASAMAMMLGLFIIIISVFQIRLITRGDGY